MGMPRGSRWKRLAVFNDEMNSDKAPALCAELRARHIEIEWWERTISAVYGPGTARNPISNLCRDRSDVSWLMVRRGDWPLAFVLAKDMGVRL